MKIRFLVILVLAASPMAGQGATFELPKDGPLFSIEMPDNWLTAEKGDVIISRPTKDSKVVISVFPMPGAKSLEEAFTAGLKELSQGYTDFKAGKSAQEKEAGMQFMSGDATAKKDGTEVRMFLFAFSPNEQRYFAITQAADATGLETYGREMDDVMGTIKSFKEEARKAKKKDDEETSAVPFPKEKPAFTMEIPNGFATDATPERLIIKSKKEHKSFFQVGAVPPADGVADEATAKAWLPKKAHALLKALGAEDAASVSGVQDHGPPIAGHKAFHARYSSDAIEELELWLFTPDGKRYFYAYSQRKAEDYKERFEDDYPLGWESRLVTSIRPAK